MAHGAYVLIVRSFRNFVCGISWALIVAKALFGTSFTRLSVCLYVHTISDFGMGTFRYDFVHSWTLNVNVYCIYEYDSHKLQQQTWTKKKDTLIHKIYIECVYKEYNCHIIYTLMQRPRKKNYGSGTNENEKKKIIFIRTMMRRVLHDLWQSELSTDNQNHDTADKNWSTQLWE